MKCVPRITFTGRKTVAGCRKPFGDNMSLNGFFLLQFHVELYKMTGVLCSFASGVSFLHLCHFTLV